MFDSNIPRWIIASVNKHFKDYSGDIPLYFDTYDGDTNWAELRFSGPDVNETSRDSFEITCIINILLTAFIDIDNYLLYRMIGTFMTAFRPICVYRFGDGLDDDQTLLGVLNLIDEVDVINYGYITTESKHKKSTLEANYKMIL